MVPPLSPIFEKIRLAEIDAPESKQPHGQRSSAALTHLILHRHVTIQYSKRGRYGRIIGTVLLNGQNINAHMIDTGHAWHYKKYSKSPALASLESTARANGLGLWASDGLVAPWTFRKR